MQHITPVEFEILYQDDSRLEQVLHSYWEFDRLAHNNPQGTTSEFVSMMTDLKIALKSIPPKHRQSIFLYHIMGHSYDEVADMMKLSRRRVRDLVSEGMGLLQDQLRERHDTRRH